MKNNHPLRYNDLPDIHGHFAEFGGRFVPETLIPAVNELAGFYASIKNDADFNKELDYYLENYAGRPTPLYYAENLSKKMGGARIYLKREDLCHTGSHKINNCLGQILLAMRMGKKRIIAETGAGQHGVAAATVAAKFNLPCEVYMGEEDVKRQALNVYRMRLLGAKVNSVKTGTKTLKDAVNEAIRDWISNVNNTYYLIGSCIGPHPYPMIVRDFQSVIGCETKGQILLAEKRLPDYLIACVGGGSNSIGLFHAFLSEPNVKMVGVEGGGKGKKTGQNAATLETGSKGILHGAKTFVLQSKTGQILPTHSVSAGLDYPGTGPEHAYLKETGRVEYVSASDKEAIAAFKMLSETEGIIPALESSHAIAHAVKIAQKTDPSQVIVICLSGRGDKDVEIVKSFKG